LTGIENNENTPYPPPYAQLQMVWPPARLDDPPLPQPPRGYSLRTYQPGDEPRWFELMALAGWPGWHEEEHYFSRILPDGWWMAVHDESNCIAASAMAVHEHSELHPFGGEVGWVIADPAHTGRGLGLAVTGAATRRFLQAGYRDIYLKTDDDRLPALKTYLKLGFLPFLYRPGMVARWSAICKVLAWPFTPEEWPKMEEDGE